MEASAPDAVADLAARGLGVAILSASMVAEREDLHAVGLADVVQEASLALVWRPEPGRALRAFLERARTSLHPAEAVA
jgi:DNA-binding transcriptional LysR family regulator